MWTPDEIRALAVALERRRGTVVRLRPETLDLVIKALQLYATEGFAEGAEGFAIEVWDDKTGSIAERLGDLALLAAAEAAYEVACAARAGRRVTLRKRGWVVRERKPE